MTDDNIKSYNINGVKHKSFKRLFNHFIKNEAEALKIIKSKKYVISDKTDKKGEIPQERHLIGFPLFEKYKSKNGKIGKSGIYLGNDINKAIEKANKLLNDNINTAKLIYDKNGRWIGHIEITIKKKVRFVDKTGKEGETDKLLVFLHSNKNAHLTGI